MSISKSTNNGNITGKGFVGGFVGYILSGSQHNSILGIIDSENNGNVSSKTSACGFFCVVPNEGFYDNTTVMNSINKGYVNASTDALGFQTQSQWQEVW